MGAVQSLFVFFFLSFFFFNTIYLFILKPPKIFKLEITIETIRNSILASKLKLKPKVLFY